MSNAVGVKRKAPVGETGSKKDSWKKSKVALPKDKSSKSKSHSSYQKGDSQSKSIKGADKKSKKSKRVEEEEESDEDEDEDMDDGDEMMDVDGEEEQEFAGFEPLNDDSEEEEGDGEDSGKSVTVKQSQPGKGTSTEAHAKQKALARERKAARPNFDLIQRSKRIWERLRRTSEVSAEERRALVEELLTLIAGRTHDFVFKHDSGRVIQCALKFAPKEHKLKIASELRGSYKALAESKYAKFLIAKLMVHGGDEVRDMVISEFYGHVRKMINHPEAAWILDDIYRGVATPKQKALMLREWYGAEFALFKDSSDTPTGDLRTILEQSPEKRKPIMDSLLGLINPLVQKKKTAFTMLHDAMLQYFLNIGPDSAECKEFFELLQSDEEFDLLKNLAFTPSGSRVVRLALARGTAANRKHLLRAYKGVISEMAYDDNAHTILVATYEVVDDTKLVGKSVLAELVGKSPEEEEFKSAVPDLTFNANGRVALLYPLSSQQKWFLTPSYAPLLDEIREASKATSKKDPVVRRAELAAYLAPFLIASVARSAAELVRFPAGCQCVAETLLLCSGDKSAAADAVVVLAEGDPATAGPDHLVNNPGRSRMLKALVRGGRFTGAGAGEDGAAEKSNGASKSDGAESLDFAARLWPVMKPHLESWATGEGAFVVLSMLEHDRWDGKDELVKKLKDGRKRIEKAVKEAETAAATATTGSKGEKKGDADGKGKGKKKGDKAKGEPRSVMPGTKLILKTLEGM